MSHAKDVPYDHVDSAPALARLAERLGAAGRIALDTEADSLHHYFEKVCLLQFAVDGSAYIVDPLAGIGLAEFLGVLAEKPLLFHGADYDLRMLRSSFGFSPRGEVHDTMLAAQLLGVQEFGLSALVERFCGVVLPKGSQKADWSRRPLPPALLEYAVDDVLYLDALADRLIAELTRLGRYGWYRQSCERMAESTATSRLRDAENAWRIKGLKGLDRRHLAFVRELWHWREQEARHADRPPFMVMGNVPLRDLAVWAADHPAASLAHGPKLPRNCRGHRLRALEKAIERARTEREADWPQRPPRPPSTRPAPDAARRVEALMAECARLAGELGIAPSVLAPRASVEAIAARGARNVDEMLACSPLVRWQAELLAPAALKVLSPTEPKE